MDESWGCGLGIYTPGWLDISTKSWIPGAFVAVDSVVLATGSREQMKLTRWAPRAIPTGKKIRGNDGPAGRQIGARPSGCFLLLFISFFYF